MVQAKWKVFRFAARGGVESSSPPGWLESQVLFLAYEPEAVRFLPVVGEEGEGVGSVGALLPVRPADLVFQPFR